MTVMFSDIHRDIDRDIADGRLVGFDDSEILYADDTLLIDVKSEALQKFMECVAAAGASVGRGRPHAAGTRASDGGTPARGWPR